MVFDLPQNSTFVTESDAERRCGQKKERRGFVSASTTSVQSSLTNVFEQQTFVLDGDKVTIRENLELEAI